MIVTVYGECCVTEQINWFFVKKMVCVLCEVVTEFLYVVLPKLRLHVSNCLQGGLYRKRNKGHN
jgi:hypothetical protein